MRIFTLLQLAIIGAHGVYARRGYGFVGYGIYYEQPSCAFACREAISGATLNCSTTDTSGSTSTDAECYATDDAFLQTLAFCVSTWCSSLSAWKLEKFWKLNVAGSNDVQPDPKETYQQALARINGTPTAEYPGSGSLNETSIVSYDLWHPNYITDVAFEGQESQQVRYGLAILLSGFIIPIGFSLLRFLPFPRLWRSKFYSLVIEPPLVGTKHDTPIFFGLLQMPKRGQALFIFYFITINTVLSAVNYDNATPNTWFDSQWGWMMMLVSDRLGVLSFANLPLVFLYGGRNNILLWLTSWSHSTFLLLHRWIAAIATLQAILHSLIYLHEYVKEGTHSSESREPYWYWGIVATLGMFILFPTSAIPIRRKFYELFLAWHVVISILIIAGCYWHIVFRFSHKWGYETWIFICMAVWGFDRVFRLLRLARFGVQTAAIKVIDDDYVRVTVPNVPSSGHAYIYFPTLTWRVWENHPFSVASSVLPADKSAKMRSRHQQTAISERDVEKQSHVAKPADGSLAASSACIASEGFQIGSTFYIRTQKGLTKLLRGRASVPVLIETGYSSESLVSQSPDESPVLIAIAGGVGFTTVLPHLLAHTGRAKLYWGCRTKSLVDEAESTYAMSRIEMETFVGVRMNIKEVLDAELSSHVGDACVMVSGPESMIDEARIVVNSIAKKSSKASVRLVVESFSW